MHSTEPRRRPPAPARPPARPAGWRAPGPPGPDTDALAAAEAALGPDEDLAYLLGDWRILQRVDGHRWSMDDLVTAWVAGDVAARIIETNAAPRVLDLGSGIGSVPLMLAWRCPSLAITGIEAQAISLGLARRSIALDGARVTIHEGDLRDLGAAGIVGPFDLITGTPPYFDDPDQPRSGAVQKGPCRFEDRGGIEAYLDAAARVMQPNGCIVICHASRQRARVLAAMAACGLAPRAALEVVPKVGKPPLVDVFTLARADATDRLPIAFTSLTVRDADDQWTPAFVALRTSMGLPPRIPRSR